MQQLRLKRVGLVEHDRQREAIKVNHSSTSSSTHHDELFLFPQPCPETCPERSLHVFMCHLPSYLFTRSAIQTHRKYKSHHLEHNTSNTAASNIMQSREQHCSEPVTLIVIIVASSYYYTSLVEAVSVPGSLIVSIARQCESNSQT